MGHGRRLVRIPGHLGVLPGPDRRVRAPGPVTGQEADEQGDRHAAQGPTCRSGGVGPTGSDSVAPAGRHPRLVRPRRVQRAGRGNQRTAGAPPRNRPGVQEPGPLHLEVTDPLRTATGPDQRTLNREEPVNQRTQVLEHTVGRVAMPSGYLVEYSFVTGGSPRHPDFPDEGHERADRTRALIRADPGEPQRIDRGGDVPRQLVEC